MVEARPVQLAIVFGATTGLYAVSLGVVTALQGEHERTIAAAQAPLAADLDAHGDANDRLEADLDRALAAYERASSEYARLADSLTAHEAGLARLGALVAQVSGSAADLPAGIRLPRAARPAARSAPATHATSASSGAP